MKKLIYWLKALKYTRGGVNPPTNRWVFSRAEKNTKLQLQGISAISCRDCVGSASA